MLSLNQKIHIEGNLTVVRRDSSSLKILDAWSKKNIITFNAVSSVIELLAPNAALGGTQAERQIKSMRFGTSNLTPQRSDLDLSAEAVVGTPVRVQLMDADRVIGAAGVVDFAASLAAGDGNGVTYREAGLFTRGTLDDPQTTVGAKLFSHQVFPDQPKTAAVTLDFLWRITLTV